MSHDQEGKITMEQTFMDGLKFKASVDSDAKFQIFFGGELLNASVSTNGSSFALQGF